MKDNAHLSHSFMLIFGFDSVIHFDVIRWNSSEIHTHLCAMEWNTVSVQVMHWPPHTKKTRNKSGNLLSDIIMHTYNK